MSISGSRLKHKLINIRSIRRSAVESKSDDKKLARRGFLAQSGLVATGPIIDKIDFGAFLENRVLRGSRE